MRSPRFPCCTHALILWYKFSQKIIRKSLWICKYKVSDLLHCLKSWKYREQSVFHMAPSWSCILFHNKIANLVFGNRLCTTCQIIIVWWGNFVIDDTPKTKKKVIIIFVVFKTWYISFFVHIPARLNIFKFSKCNLYFKLTD